MKTLKLGSSNWDVKVLQVQLRGLGYDLGQVDGVFGRKTEALVRRFQKNYGLLTDGIVGKMTWGAIEKALQETGNTLYPFKAAAGVQIRPHFTEDEFACPCCGILVAEPRMLDLIRLLRVNLKMPLNVTSGYRCSKHNGSLKGASPQSRHMLGQAADVWSPGYSPREVAAVAERVGFGGIGVYVSDSFIHIDTGPKRKWKYN